MIKINDTQLELECILVSQITREMVLRNHSDESIITKITSAFEHPLTLKEQEKYSECILMAKLAVLN
jgi:hypothetical protein